MTVSQKDISMAKGQGTINRFCLLAFAILVLLGCDRADFRNGYAPGEVETIDNAKVYHLKDGVFIEERTSGRVCYYLIESTVADYALTPQGLDIVLEGENAGTYFLPAAPQGYMAAWVSEVEGDDPGATRFQIDGAKVAELLGRFSEATTVQEIYRLKQ